MMNSPFGYNHMYGGSWFYGFGPGVALLYGLIGTILLVVLIALKGYALWTAAKRDEKWWFIAMLILNTVGILEVVYLVFFVKQLHKRNGNHTEHHDHPHHPAQFAEQPVRCGGYA